VTVRAFALKEGEEVAFVSAAQVDAVQHTREIEGQGAAEVFVDADGRLLGEDFCGKGREAEETATHHGEKGAEGGEA